MTTRTRQPRPDLGSIAEPARHLPVVADVDLCVVGGSCTGVFAAVAAARQGLSVCVVEQLNLLGGTATASQVCVWHSLWDWQGRTQVISGLTETLIRRVQARGAVTESARDNHAWQFSFNPMEMVLGLDRLVEEHRIQVRLHTRVAAVALDGRRVTAVIIEDKDGRGAIRCKQVVDASGDADVLRRAGVGTRHDDTLQPPTCAAMIQGLKRIAAANPGFKLAQTLFDPTRDDSLPRGFLWSQQLAGGDDLTMVYGTRVHGADCADAQDLTRAEIEGRRQVQMMVDLLRRRFPEQPVTLVSMPQRIGIRQTRHARCAHTLTMDEVLHGAAFPDAIANGSYRVDIHHANGDGLTFKDLDGMQHVIKADGSCATSRWRPDGDYRGFYQVPYRSLLPRDLDNVVVAGRCLDADQGAFGAVRVMVVCNQMGEAAGTAAALAQRAGSRMCDVDPTALRATLSEHGALMV